MMIFKKAIPRRTFLRGVGATVALPLLDGMIPAFASQSQAAVMSPVRLSICYVPNGIIPPAWKPATVGPDFEITPVLESLSKFRDRFLVLSGLSSKLAEAAPGDGGQTAPHELACGAFLTGAHPHKEGRVGVSMDQVLAQELGQHTQLASLELGIEAPDVTGQCALGWNCSFIHTLSWRSPTTPVPIENQPRLVFERLFGDSNTTDPAERLARISQNRSILDWMSEAVARIMKSLDLKDRAKLAEYLDSIRDVERRISRAEEQSSRELPVLDRPAGIPATYDEHAKIMFDLMTHALQSDMTRVITFMMGREQSDWTYREIGIFDAHHPTTHHQNDPVKIAKVTKINIFHATLLSYYLEKLASTPDGDGSLLDHSMVLYGSGLGDGSAHAPHDLPILLVGEAGGQIKGGCHIQYPKETPVTNLFLTIMDRMGVPQDSFGDSTGRLDLSHPA